VLQLVLVLLLLLWFSSLPPNFALLIPALRATLPPEQLQQPQRQLFLLLTPAPPLRAPASAI